MNVDQIKKYTTRRAQGKIKMNTSVNSSIIRDQEIYNKIFLQNPNASKDPITQWIKKDRSSILRTNRTFWEPRKDKNHISIIFKNIWSSLYETSSTSRNVSNLKKLRPSLTKCGTFL